MAAFFARSAGNMPKEKIRCGKCKMLYWRKHTCQKVMRMPVKIPGYGFKPPIRMCDECYIGHAKHVTSQGMALCDACYLLFINVEDDINGHDR
jgi:hypothetical protein